MAKNDTLPQEQKPTNRQRLNDRFSGNEDYMDDDEYLYGSAADALDEADKSRAERESFNKAINDSDISPAMMAGLLSGKNEDGSDFNLQDYLFDEHLDYFIDYLEDKASAKEKFEARKKERQTEEEEAKKFLEERADKIAKEDAELDEAMAEMGYKAEDVQELIDWVYGKKDEQGNVDGTGLLSRASHFELTKDDFIRLMKLKDYDAQIKTAEDRGYKKGRNEKIDMFDRGQQRRQQLPPDMNSGGKPAAGAKKEEEDPTLARLKKMQSY